MNRIFIYLARFALILLGYAAASLATSAFIHLLFLGSQDWEPGQVPAVIAGSLIFSVPFVALFVAYFAFLPSIPLVLLAEILGRRGWLFYAVGGALVAGVVFGMFWMASLPIAGGVGLAEEPAVDPVVREPGFAALLAGGGIVGGIAYWLVAGRFAGGWRDRIGGRH